MMKLKADSVQEIPFTTQSRIFCLQVCYKNIDIKIYRTIILSVVWHGCETWLVTRLMLFWAIT